MRAVKSKLQLPLIIKDCYIESINNLKKLMLLDLSKNDWHNLQEEGFQVLFQRSAVKRTKFQGLKRNITYLKGK